MTAPGGFIFGNEFEFFPTIFPSKRIQTNTAVDGHLYHFACAIIRAYTKSICYQPIKLFVPPYFVFPSWFDQ
jgi:hypothetical protein